MRYAVRSLSQNPASTLLAVISLAVGIGANTLMFSIVDAVLRRPLPYPQSERLVFVWSIPPGEPDQKRPATIASYRALIEQGSVFEHVGSVGGVGDTATLEADSGGTAEEVEGQRLSAAIPQALGAIPLKGRWFTEAEAGTNASPVIVISNRLWQRRFGQAADIVGRTVRLDGNVATIIGVMPEGWMLFNYPAQFWAPDHAGDASGTVLPLARLKAGIGLRQAQEEMNRFARNLSDSFPATHKGWGIRLEPALEVYVGWVRQPLLIAQGVALLVMLIACANTAGLLLVRATGRAKEIGLRVALGGGPWQISRQLLSECVLLSVCATLLGVALAYVGLKGFVLLSPAWFPRAAEIGLHVRVLAATVATSAVTALTFGMIPAWQASRLNVARAIGEWTCELSSGTRPQKIRSALVVLQISAALTLVTGAGLMINSFVRLYNSSPGCDPRNVITFQIRIPANRRTSVGAPVFERIRERISGIPGVVSVAFASHAPFSESPPPVLPFVIEGRQGDGRRKQTAMRFEVSSGYFRALETPVVRGREFLREDATRATHVVLINEAIARRFWPGESPVGHRIALGANEPGREIIGVVGDLRHDRRAEEAEMQVYVPYGSTRRRSPDRASHDATFLVRGADDPARLMPFVRAAAAAEDRGIPVFHIKTIEEHIAVHLWQPRQTMTLFSIFSAVAVLLAMSGVFGIVSYMVKQRTHEIGIRIALGATKRDVMMLVMKRGLALAGVGIAGGIFGSLLLAGLLRSLLWGVSGTDAVSYSASILLLAAAAALACYVPARQAVRVDAWHALRAE